MESVIKNNLQTAQRGGVPGSASLIEAYLNVRLNAHYQYQVLIMEHTFLIKIFSGR